MKKNLFQFMTILMVSVLSVSFVACSSDDDDGGSNGNLIGTWRKYKSDDTSSSELSHVIWVFERNSTMYEHNIDDDINIIEGSTETFKYKTENGHLYTDKLKKDGYRNEWKDEGALSISGETMTLTKEEGKVKRLKKIR